MNTPARISSIEISRRWVSPPAAIELLLLLQTQNPAATMKRLPLVITVWKTVLRYQRRDGAQLVYETGNDDGGAGA